MQDKTQRPPIAQSPLSVILLALGSTSDTAESLSSWREFLATLDRPFELMVVEPAGGPAAADTEPNPILAEARRIEYDAAAIGPITPATAGEADAHGIEGDLVRGFGTALVQAIHAAQYPLVMLATADRQFQHADLKVLLAAIDPVDIAVGCRSVSPWSLPWRLVGGFFLLLGRVVLGLPPPPGGCTAGATPWQRRWVARWAFALRLKDPESPFRLLRREAAVRILLQSRGLFALVEQLAKANHLEFIMTEEPVSWSPAPAPIPFVQEAWELFRRPDFGPAELHIPRPGPPVEALPVVPEAIPTKPESPSS